jgi:electron transfer flavoprotein beta subunit
VSFACKGRTRLIGHLNSAGSGTFLEVPLYHAHRRQPQATFFSPESNEESMKVLVAVKRVVDYNVKVRVKADNSGVDLANVKMSMNPFCEIAVEEAVRLKEKALRRDRRRFRRPDHRPGATAYRPGLGADRAILVESAEELNSLAVAKALKAVVDKEQPQLVILGKQAIDSDNNQTGQMLAALTGYARAPSPPRWSGWRQAERHP